MHPYEPISFLKVICIFLIDMTFVTYRPKPSLTNFQLKTSAVRGIGAENDLLGGSTGSMI